MSDEENKAIVAISLRKAEELLRKLIEYDKIGKPNGIPCENMKNLLVDLNLMFAIKAYENTLIWQDPLPLLGHNLERLEAEKSLELNLRTCQNCEEDCFGHDLERIVLLTDQKRFPGVSKRNSPKMEI
jgi:hypothetical protein